MPSVAELRGLWRRSLIAWPDGRRDTTTTVSWLQGASAYVDLRQPAELPGFGHARGLAQLTLEDCRHLAAQEGFAGRFGFDGTHFEWARAIDYQPKPLYSDAGSLHWQGDVLVEEGRDVAYVEHWHRDPAAPVQPVAALTLRDAQTGVSAVLLRVGPHFMMARDRAVTAPAHKSLLECVDAAASLAEAQALVDCEISFGRVEADGFRIGHSTLPYRVGDRLAQSFAGTQAIMVDRDAQGGAVIRHWDIVESEGGMDALACHPGSNPAGSPS